MSPFGPGLRLHDRFTLVERIGLGGMSEVWRADDRVLDRRVAVKVLAAPLTGDRALRAATWREARAAARLAHPHVTQVYDYGEAPLPGGAVVPYLVMELVHGQNLADRLRQGAPPWPDAVRTVAQVASALAAAHRMGVVHRDIKPGNVMLTAGGAKVLDFGIAALADRPEPAGRSVVGTPGYVAPEVLGGATAGPASDVYALGVLLYEVLTRRPPSLVASFAEAAAVHRGGAPVPPPNVTGLPAQVSRLCLACMSFDPADRPTAEDVATQLGAVAGQGDSEAPPAVPAAPVVSAPPTLVDRRTPDPLPVRRTNHLLLAGLAGALIAVGLTLTVVAATFLSGEPAGTAQPAPTGGSSRPAPSSPRPAPTTPAAVVSALDRTVTAALGAGRIDSQAAGKLRGRIDKLRDQVTDGGADRDVRKQAAQLQKDVAQQLGAGTIDQQTADQLTTLLRPLLTG